MVVGVVSRRGARRRELHRAAHAGGEEREGRARRHAVLQRRALRAAAVAVDHRRAGVDARLSDSSTTSAARSRTWIPSLIGHDMAYPAMLTFLPAGLLGLMVAGLLAAYVSTISTHLNWGTSYLVHDFYRRFMQPGADERHYVLVGRLVTAALMVLAAALTFVLDTAQASFNLLLSVGAGTGLHLPAALVLVAHQRVERDRGDGQLVRRRGRVLHRRQERRRRSRRTTSLLITVAVTTVVWVAATYLTAPTDRATLVEFYPPRAAGRSGVGTGSRRKPASVRRPTASRSRCSAGCSDVSSCTRRLFGAGSFLYGRTAQGIDVDGRLRRCRRPDSVVDSGAVAIVEPVPRPPDRCIERSDGSSKLV